MVSRKLKQRFYDWFNPLMYINGILHKSFRAPNSNNNQTIKVHLGPGQKNYLDGWINVDANIFTAKIDLWANLINTLPFKKDSVDIFYSHHVIEHLPDLKKHLNEMYEALKPNGKIRIGGPNGDTAIKQYINGNKDWFISYPEERKSIGGKLENFIFCKNEHLTILTYSYLDELLTDTGFKNIKLISPEYITGFPQYIDQNVLNKEWNVYTEFPITIMIEAEK